MGSQRFRAVIAAGPRNSAVIAMPFDPDEAWGAKADHPVSGTIGGCRIRTRLVPADSGWVLTLAPKRLLSMGIAIGDEVTVEPRRSRPTRRRAHSSIRWRSSTARPTYAGSTRPPAGRICARPASLKSSACSRRGSKSGHDREGRLPGAIMGDRAMGSPPRARLCAPRGTQPMIGNRHQADAAAKPGRRA
jgi:Domain of unknown function (DUF1905)